MSKMHYSILVTNFQKSPSARSFPPSAPLNLQYWWPEVPWFGQIVVFEAGYDEIEFQNITMKSFQWRHHHCVTEKRHQNNVTNFFQIWAPSNQNFWLRQCLLQIQKILEGWATAGRVGS